MFKCLNMPQKTKKQKIAAAKRKHTFFLQNEFNNFKVETPSITVTNAPLKRDFQPSKPLIISKEVNEFKKDLFKSLVLTFLILSMTVGLYLTRESSFIKFF